MEAADCGNLGEHHNTSRLVDSKHTKSARGDVHSSNANNFTLVPPYWSHQRHESYSSVGNTKPAAITLEDHTGENFPESHWAWAKGVTIDDYVLVAGSVPNLGNFVVWNCKIDTLDVSTVEILHSLLSVMCLYNSKGGLITIRKRYR